MCGWGRCRPTWHTLRLQLCYSRAPAWLTQSPQVGRGPSTITGEQALSPLLPPALLGNSGTLPPLSCSDTQKCRLPCTHPCLPRTPTPTYPDTQTHLFVQVATSWKSGTSYLRLSPNFFALVNGTQVNRTYLDPHTHRPLRCPTSPLHVQEQGLQKVQSGVCS